MMKKKISNAFIGLGILCIVAALILQFNNEYEDTVALKNEQVAVSIIKNELSEVTDNTVTEEDTSEEEFDDEYEMPSMVIEGYEYIGYLSFDVLDAEFPIIADWDYTKLKQAPCRYSGTLNEHNLVIAGHNYRKGFRRLKDLQVGDKVFFTTMKGKKIVYEVDMVDVIEPTNIEEMVYSPWDLSLYTCTYDGKQRYTVRCNEITN